MKRSGRKSAAQTPAPAKERIYGSKKNPEGSAASKTAARDIELSLQIIKTLKEKQEEHNEKYPSKKVELSTLKAVMRRGMGAYSKSHRPTITGGEPNSRQAWGFARVNKFLDKQAGKQVKAAYVQDDDLLKYAKGGLVAPNGKPSNLTPEQYKIVRTPEFKAWFGDWENDPENASKVVDENGEPLVVYHGTKSENVDIFSEKRPFGDFYGIYFTPKIDYANKYGLNIIKCFLNIRKPLISEKSVGSILPKYLYEFYKKTHDGIIWNKSNNLTTADEVVAFNSNQIKLADGTNTTFDARNPDIRFEDGGSVSSRVEKFMKWYINWVKDVSTKMNIFISIPTEITKPINGVDNYVFLDLFEKIDQNIDAKPYLKKITDKADELGVAIVLEPIPRYKYFKNDVEKRKKIDTNYLIQYYSKFGFVLQKDGMMIRKPDSNPNPDIRFEDGGSVSGTIALPDTFSTFEKLQPILRNQGYEIKKIDMDIQQLSEKHSASEYFEFVKAELGVNVLKPAKSIEQIAKEKNVPLDYAKEQLAIGIEDEKLHSNLPEVQERIVLQHLDENIDFYQLMKNVEQSSSTKKESGGYLVSEKDGQVIAHNDADKGGLLVGRLHSEGGIKGENTSTNQKIEVEDGELAVSSKAVHANNTNTFNGQKMSNKQVLSYLNQRGGGVAFADGGEVTKEPIKYKGGEVILTRGVLENPEKYEFNGQMMTSKEIASAMNEQATGYAFDEGGEVTENDTKPIENQSVEKHLYQSFNLKSIPPFLRTLMLHSKLVRLDIPHTTMKGHCVSDGNIHGVHFFIQTKDDEVLDYFADEYMQSSAEKKHQGNYQLLPFMDESEVRELIEAHIIKDIQLIEYYCAKYGK